MGVICNGYGGLFLKDNLPEREPNHSPLSSTEVKNAFTCITAVEWCLVSTGQPLYTGQLSLPVTLSTRFPKVTLLNLGLDFAILAGAFLRFPQANAMQFVILKALCK
jgi:hypothetical protein